jgi:Na+/melibiose symporter-like transporter
VPPCPGSDGSSCAAKRATISDQTCLPDESVRPLPRLSWARALLFASGDFACNLYWQSVALYLLFYYTDVAHLAPEVAGLIYMAGSAWDGVAGLLIGILSDRGRGPGRGAQGYILFGAVPLGLSFLLLYWVPPLGGGALAMAVLGAHLLFRTFYAFVNVPYAALSAQVARTSADRARVAGLRMIFGAAAAAAIAVGTQAIATRVTGRPDGALGFLAAAALASGLATAILIIVSLKVQTGRQALPTAPVPLPAMGLSIARNRAFLILNLAMFAAVIAITTVTKGTLYYFKYRLGDEGAAGSALALMGISGVAFVPVWMAVAARWGVRTQWWGASACGAVAVIAFWAAEPATAAGMRIFLVAFQAAITGFSFGFWAMLPDSVEHGERASGVRLQVLLFGLAALLQKVAIGVAAALVGFLLGLSGYVADAVQSSATLQGLRMAMTLVPLVALAGAAVAMAFSPKEEI